MTALRRVSGWLLRVDIASSQPVRAAFDLRGATELGRPCESFAEWPDLTVEQSLGMRQAQ